MIVPPVRRGAGNRKRELRPAALAEVGVSEKMRGPVNSEIVEQQCSTHRGHAWRRRGCATLRAVAATRTATRGRPSAQRAPGTRSHRAVANVNSEVGSGVEDSWHVRIQDYVVHGDIRQIVRCGFGTIGG